MKILLINGVNLNMLGTREVEKYGTTTLTDIEDQLVSYAKEKNVTLDTYQSNYEGALVEKIHQSLGLYDGIIINAGAYTHTSIAIRDALLTVQIPTVEVHITNVYKRENFRHHSMLSDVCLGVVAGFGKMSYQMALDGLIIHIQRT